MDDNNVFAHGISDELMRELLSKSDLRLAISPEMRNEYEKKHNLKFWVLPPVVAPNSIATQSTPYPGKFFESKTGILIGSLWSGAWLRQLRAAVRQSGLQVHWYGNSNAAWLREDTKGLERDGIIDCGFIPEAELTKKLKDFPYAIIPTGTLDADDDRQEISRLSLPSRMTYLTAIANMPLLVVGSPETAAAKFIQRFKVGTVCEYDGEKLRTVVEQICLPNSQAELRKNAADSAAVFSAKGVGSWIWESLEIGQAVDNRYENRFERSRSDVYAYIDPPIPRDLFGDFALVYQALRRLSSQGFEPNFVLDVGASTGIWSDMAKRVFPSARFVLVDPLFSKYKKISSWYFKKNPGFECVEAAVSDYSGAAQFDVSDDLYGSSLLDPNDCRNYESINVPVVTLDDLAHQKKITGRGLLKIDVQFAEHLVLAGASELLCQVDAVLVELSLVKFAVQAKVFGEMYSLMQSLGFRYYEDTGGWRCPVDGTTVQKDVLFVREEKFVYRLDQ